MRPEKRGDRGAKLCHGHRRNNASPADSVQAFTGRQQHPRGGTSKPIFLVRRRSPQRRHPAEQGWRRTKRVCAGPPPPATTLPHVTRAPGARELIRLGASHQPPGAAEAPRRSSLLVVLGVLMLVLAQGRPLRARAQSPAGSRVVDREYLLKAVFLYKFAGYVEWPGPASASSSSPLAIGVLGRTPLSRHLRTIAAVKRVNGRRIEVRQFADAREVVPCHILFISRAVDDRTQAAVLRKLSGKRVLLVGETPDFLDHGGVIRFGVQDNRIRLFISRLAYQRQGLRLSAQLLRVAAVVD